MNVAPSSLLELELPSARGPRRVVLRMPRMVRVSSLLYERAVARDAERLIAWLPNLALDFVAQLDGAKFRYDRLDELLRDPELTRGVLLAIRNWLDASREQGRAFVLCPGCRAWEAEVSITAFALTIGSPVPSSFEGPFLAAPALDAELPLSVARPAFSYGARVRFELPSVALKLGGPISAGALGEVTAQPEEDLPPPPLRFDQDDDDEGEEDEDAELDESEAELMFEPNREGAGFRALLRLSRAIEPAISLEQAEDLYAVDFFFLDLLYYLVSAAPVRHDTAGIIACPQCATRFVPVRGGD